MPSSRHSIAALGDELFSSTLLTSEKEAVQRAAIGRWYYSVFYLAIEVTQAFRVPAVVNADDFGSHERVYRALVAFAETLDVARAGQLKSAVLQARALKLRRRDADYDLDMRIDGMFALQSQSAARRLTNIFENLLETARPPFAQP